MKWVRYWLSLLNWYSLRQSDRMFLSPLDICLINRLGYDGFKKNQTAWWDSMRPAAPPTQDGMRKEKP